jgi:ABC-type dipeptide/oligopeptide/nickel transport system permease component
MVPLMPTFMSDVLYVISGSLIIEQIFAVPGIGKTYLLSISNRDYSVFMAISMFYIVIGLAAGILFDLSYGFIDPRIRMGGDKTNEL